MSRTRTTSHRAVNRFILAFVLWCGIAVLFLTGATCTFATETPYKFERLWPTLQQPYYFQNPLGLSTDAAGNVYLIDSDRLYKLTPDGTMVKNWGGHGTGNGQFSNAQNAVVDSSGNVYVSDSANNRIQKFTSDGTFVTKWGTYGSGDGQFWIPNCVAVDDIGDVYVADTFNNRIQKFTSDGTFVTKWSAYSVDGVAVQAGSVYVSDNSGTEVFTLDGVFVSLSSTPLGPLDNAGNIYTLNNSAYCVRVFARDGTLLRQWGTYGRGDGQFNSLSGIAVTSDNLVYVSDRGNKRIQVFALDGTFVAAWASHGTNNGQFDIPLGMAVDSGGNVYVADMNNRRIQKFTSNGVYLTEWSVYDPVALAVDATANVFVTDPLEHRIFRCTSSGTILTSWGGLGSGNGQFNTPNGVAVAGDGSVYVSDNINNNVQKFTSDGTYIGQYGSSGSGDGQFNQPYGVAVDGMGNVYVADTFNNRIQKFTSDGTFILKWGSQGSADGQFGGPNGIAVGPDGSIYVADSGNNRIQKFTSGGVFITKFGSYGHEAGLLSIPFYVAVDNNGNVYVSDQGNNRIEKFTPVSLSSNPKAVVVAAGGPFPGNNLWDATEASANFAYRSLNYQGFTKDTIRYLSSDTQLDLDSNGVADDVAGDATNANLEHALTTWAPAQVNGLPTGDVVVYLVDHGGDRLFRMNANETLSDSDLGSWLNTMQAGIQGKVTVLIDACRSGSFLPALAAPPEFAGKRITVASTLPSEVAYFTNAGMISVSNYFWTQVFNGSSVGDAFTSAYGAMRDAYGYQTPQLDDTGNGIGNEAGDGLLAATTFIGNATPMNWSGPAIGAVCAPQTINGSTTATLWADPVTDSDGVGRVWATIRPPDFAPDPNGSPVAGLPSFDLQLTTGNHYEGSWSMFTTPGIYDIVIYARDRIGNTSAPRTTTVTVQNPLHRRALLVAGGTTADPLWPAFERLGGLAYQALRFQGYDDSDIDYESQTTTPGVDKMGTLSNIQYTITTWAANQTQDLTIYLVGAGQAGSFQVNTAEMLQASQLAGWLDTLQTTLPGKVTVVYDGSYSGSFLPLLASGSGKPRYVVTSATDTQQARFLYNANVSFSKFFWDRVLNGMTVEPSFKYAANAVKCGANAQDARLDDDGDGVYNTKKDGPKCRYYQIGSGILLAGAPPMIGSISPAQVVQASCEATIWADQVTTTGTIDKVWAVISPPGSADPVTLELGSVAKSTRYQGTYGGFIPVGIYDISVYAMDTEGSVSTQLSTTVEQQQEGVAPDAYEVDNGFMNAAWIGTDMPGQDHNFHIPGDEDWVQFYAEAGNDVTIETVNLGSDADTYIELYAGDGVTLLMADDDSGIQPLSSYINWPAVTSDFYFLRIYDVQPTACGVNATYTIRVFHPTQPDVGGTIQGKVFVDGTSQLLGAATLSIASLSKSTTSAANTGQYCFRDLPQDTYEVHVSLAGYQDVTQPQIVVNSGLPTKRDFYLKPLEVVWNGFTEQPANAKKYTGEGLVFSVAASVGSGTPNYQWKWDGGGRTIHDGPTTQTWQLNNLTAANSGTYWCEVTYNSVVHESAHATLDIVDHLAIATDPIGGTVPVDQPFTFGVATTGGWQPLAFQWKKNGIDVPSATTAQLALSPVRILDSGTYTVDVRDADTDVATSAGAVLTVSGGATLPVTGSAPLAILVVSIALAGATVLVLRSVVRERKSAPRAT